MRSKYIQQKRLLLYELKQNIVNRKYQYLLPVAVALQYCISTQANTERHLSALSFYEGFLKGIPAIAAGSGQSFLIPGDWCIFLFYLLYIVGKTSKDYTKGVGMQTLLRTQDTNCIWRAKWLVCIGNICIYYGGAYLGITLFNLWEYRSVTETFFNKDTINTAQFFIAFFLPVLTVSVICIWQHVLSMFIGSVGSVFIMCAFLIVSAYFEKWFLIGNFLMKLRIYDLIKQKRTGIEMIAFLLLLLVIGIFLGGRMMRGMDYIHSKGDW